MTFTRTNSIIALIAAVTLPLSSAAATPESHDSHHPAGVEANQIAQASPAKPGMGMGGAGAMPAYGEQMRAMRQMHDKLLAAKTPEERQALMAEQMKLMHGGMAMMGQMGAGTPPGASGPMAGPNATLEQRMDMMQTMMQMMMDRMQYAPAAK